MRVLKSLIIFLILTNYSFAAPKGRELNSDTLREVSKTTCGYINNKWRPGKLKKDRLFYTHSSRIKNFRKRIRKSNNERVRANLTKKLNRFLRKQRKGKRVCKKLYAPGNILLDDDDFRAITNSREILAGIKIEEDVTVLSVINNSSSSLASPALSIYDLSTGLASEVTVFGTREIESNSRIGLVADFSSTPDSESLILLSFGDSPAAIFFYKTDYEELSVALKEPAPLSQVGANFLNIDVNPGVWNFEMNLGTEYLTGINCPGGSSSTTSSGSSTLNVFNNDDSLLLEIDGSYVNLNRTSVTFKSPDYTFPVETDSGTSYGLNHWDLNPVSQTRMTGILDWDNHQGCTAEYPIQLEFESLSNPNNIALCEGIWTMDIGPLVCVPGTNTVAPTVIPPSSLTFFPPLAGELDVTYAGDYPVLLEFSSMTSFSSLYHGGNNVYGNPITNSMLGATIDSNGMPLVIMGGFQFFAINTERIVGSVVITGAGANPCTGTTSFSLNYSGSNC